MFIVQKLKFLVAFLNLCKVPIRESDTFSLDYLYVPILSLLILVVWVSESMSLTLGIQLDFDHKVGVDDSCSISQ